MLNPLRPPQAGKDRRLAALFELPCPKRAWYMPQPPMGGGLGRVGGVEEGDLTWELDVEPERRPTSRLLRVVQRLFLPGCQLDARS